MAANGNKHITRRKFIHNSAVVSAGITAGLAAIESRSAVIKNEEAIKKTRSYNPNMEYRRLGKTDLWISAVCLGGHWKRIDKVIKTKSQFAGYSALPAAPQADLDAFDKNRWDIVSKCIESGINLIDVAATVEPPVYGKALKGRREKMYVAATWGNEEFRDPDGRNAKKMVELFENGLRETGLEYLDIWRVMALEQGGQHSEADVDEMIKALDMAKTKGLCRYTGFSTHDRKWAKMLIEKYPGQMQVLCTPYTADSKVLPEESLFDAVKKYDVGVLAIKPFASNSLFKGDGSPDSPQAEEDDRRARMAIRYILCNPAITAPIPGLISEHQVDNMVQAVKEGRELDHSEEMELRRAGKEMWAKLPEYYQWLKDWEYV